MRCLLGLLIGCLLLAGCGIESEGLPERISIVGAKLIDGTGAPPIPYSVVVVEGDRIRAVGTQAATPVPKGSTIVDGLGKVIIPGLVDSHVHYYQSRNEIERILGVQLAFGVTAARSVGTDPDELSETIRQTSSPRPRVLTSGLGFTHPEGHPVGLDFLNRPATPEEARLMVEKLAAQGVDCVTIWVDSKDGSIPKIASEVRAAIVAAAREHDLAVVAHIFDQEDVKQLGNLGVTEFLHTVRDSEPMSAEFSAWCRAEGISFAPTLSVIESRWLFYEQFAVLTEDREAQVALPSNIWEQLQKPEFRAQRMKNPEIAIMRPELERAKRFVKQMHEAGVMLTLGSDSGGGIPAGWGTHHEMELMAGAGVPPLDIIRIATGDTARTLGPKGTDLGTLEAGKLADLIILSADPEQDIANARKIDRVMLGGGWVDRSALLQ
jgi:imidazolonepropionase-like amidohydrolase